jgi:hypothetical protein
LAAWHVPKDLAREYVEEVVTAFECEVRKAGDGWSGLSERQGLRIGDVRDRMLAWAPAMQNLIGAVTGMMPREAEQPRTGPSSD